MEQRLEHQFTVDNQGLLHESAAVATVEGILKAVPDADRTALEAEFMLQRAARLVNAIRDSHWEAYGLTYTRVLLLRLLHTSAENRLSMGELATLMNLGSNSVTQLVDALSRQGLVERSSAERDKRIVIVSLTEGGRSLTNVLLPENVRRIADAWAPLTNSERLTLIHLLAKVRLHLLADGSGLGDSQALTVSAETQ